MMARKPTGSAKDCIDKHAPRIQIQFPQLQWPLFGFFFFFFFQRHQTGIHRRGQDPVMDRRLIS